MPVSVSWNGDENHFDSNDIEALRIQVSNRFGLKGVPFQLVRADGDVANSMDLEEFAELTVHVSDDSLETLEKKTFQLNNRKWFVILGKLDSMQKDINKLTTQNEALTRRCEGLEQTVQEEKEKVKKLEAATKDAKANSNRSVTLFGRRKSHPTFRTQVSAPTQLNTSSASKPCAVSHHSNNRGILIKSSKRSQSQHSAAGELRFGNEDSLSNDKELTIKKLSDKQSVCLDVSSSVLTMDSHDVTPIGENTGRNFDRSTSMTMASDAQDALKEELREDMGEDIEAVKLGLERDLLEVQVALEASIAGIKTQIEDMQRDIDGNAVELKQSKKLQQSDRQASFGRSKSEGVDLGTKRIDKIEYMYEEIIAQIPKWNEDQEKVQRLEQVLKGLNGINLKQDLDEIHLAILNIEERDAARKKETKLLEEKLAQFKRVL